MGPDRFIWIYNDKWGAVQLWFGNGILYILYLHIDNGDELLIFLEALSNPHRLRIIHGLSSGKQYVSQLARELGISRPLLYLHLKKLEEANIVSSDMELLDSGKAAKYYTLNSFNLLLNEQLISQLISTLTQKNK